MPARVGFSSTTDHECPLLLADLFLFEVERFFLIFLAAEDADLDVVGEWHRRFRTVAVSLHLACLNLKRDLIFPSGVFCEVAETVLLS